MDIELIYFPVLFDKKRPKASICIFIDSSGKVWEQCRYFCKLFRFFFTFFLSSAEQVENKCTRGKKAAIVPLGFTQNVRNMLLMTFLLLHLVPTNLERIFLFHNNEQLQTSANALHITVILSAYKLFLCVVFFFSFFCVLDFFICLFCFLKQGHNLLQKLWRF